jgi:uncharacterized protein DUF3489
MREVSAEGTIENNMATREIIITDQGDAVAQQGVEVAPEKASSGKAPHRKKGARADRKAPAGGRPKAAAPKKRSKARKDPAKVAPTGKASAPRAETKGAKILEMIRRVKGATLAEIMKATGWQAHSVRGFLSVAGRRHAIKIESLKNDDGERLYKIA